MDERAGSRRGRRAAAGWRTVACSRWPRGAAGAPARAARAAPACWWSATACRPSTAWRAAAAGWRCSSSACAQGRHRRHGGQRQHQRRHHLGRPLAPAGAAEAAPADARGHRTRRQRRAARPAAGDDARQPGRRWRAPRAAAGAKVLVLGMQVPPNYGRKYGDDFAALFAQRGQGRAARRWCPSCSKAWPTRRMPRRCSSPTASTRRRAAHPVMLDNVWPVLAPLLK